MGMSMYDCLAKEQNFKADRHFGNFIYQIIYLWKASDVRMLIKITQIFFHAKLSQKKLKQSSSDFVQ